MKKTDSLVEYIKDDFVLEPKQILKRIKKEVTLDLEGDFCPVCWYSLKYHYLSHPRKLVTIKYDISLRVVYEKCVNEESHACKTKRNFYNLSLDLYELPKKEYAMDVVPLIGHLLLQEYYTEEKVVEDLKRQKSLYSTFTAKKQKLRR